MAMRDSVTVSMSAEMTGMFRLQSLRQRRVELRVARQDLRVKRRQRDVVVGQPEAAVGREEGIRRLVELGIELVGLFMRCHVF